MRYAQIQDIRELPVWRNHNAVVLYYYVAMCADYQTREAKRSIRTMAKQCNLSAAAVRHALRVLERAGVIEVYSTPTETTITMAPLTLPKAKLITTGQAAAILKQHQDNVCKVLAITPDRYAAVCELFIQHQQLKGKQWSDERDLCSHLTSWYYRQAKQMDERITTKARADERESEERHTLIRRKWIERLPIFRANLERMREAAELHKVDDRDATDEEVRQAKEWLASDNVKQNLQAYAKLGFVL